MQASSEIVIKQPAERIDLARWVSTLSDGDYQACSPGHRAAGIFSEGGTFGSVNVENVGGHLLVQHYLAVFASPERVVMHSRNTRAYVMHLFPATIEVTWTVAVQPLDSDSALLRCAVETRMPVLLLAVATLALLPLFLRWHVQAETPFFAKDIARKINGGALSGAGSSRTQTPEDSRLVAALSS